MSLRHLVGTVLIGYVASVVAVPAYPPSSSPISCSAATQIVNGRTCTTCPNTDRPGGDYLQKRTGSFQSCVELCAQEVQCVTAQYHEDNGYCYLKNSKNDARSATGVDTVDCGPAKPVTSTSKKSTTTTKTTAKTTTTTSVVKSLSSTTKPTTTTTTTTVVKSLSSTTKPTTKSTTTTTVVKSLSSTTKVTTTTTTIVKSLSSTTTTRATTTVRPSITPSTIVTTTIKTTTTSTSTTLSAPSTLPTCSRVSGSTQQIPFINAWVFGGPAQCRLFCSNFANALTYALLFDDCACYTQPFNQVFENAISLLILFGNVSTPCRNPDEPDPTFTPTPSPTPTPLEPCQPVPGYNNFGTDPFTNTTVDQNDAAACRNYCATFPTAHTYKLAWSYPSETTTCFCFTQYLFSSGFLLAGDGIAGYGDVSLPCRNR